MSDAKEAALKSIRQIYDAFGFDEVDAEEGSALFAPLCDGTLVFDASKETLEYRLSRPIELKNGEKMTVVTFKEAAASETEYIRKGVSITNSSQFFSLGDLATMTLKVLIKTGGMETNLADRIKSRDLDALSKIMTELGFFFR